MQDDSTSASADATTTAGTAVKAARLHADVADGRAASALLAQATRVSEQAFADSDALVHEAEEIAERLVTEARERADGILVQARAEAGILIDSDRDEADQLRRSIEEDRDRWRAEARVEAQQEVAAVRLSAEQLAEDVEIGLKGLQRMLSIAGAAVEEITHAGKGLAATAGRLVPDGEAPAGAASDGPEAGSPSGPTTVEIPVEETAEQALDAPSDGSGDDDGGQSASAPPLARTRSDVSVEANLRLDTTPGSIPGRLDGGPREDLDDALAAARPLGWLFRGN